MNWLQVAISFGKIILLSIRPGTELLGRLPGTDLFCDIRQYPMAIETPGVFLIRINSGLMCFANANFIRERWWHISQSNWILAYGTKEYIFDTGLYIIFFILLCFRIMRSVTEEDDAKRAERRKIEVVVLDMSSKSWLTQIKLELEC